MKKGSILMAIIGFIFFAAMAKAHVGEWDEFRPLDKNYDSQVIGKVVSPSHYEVTVNAQNKTSVIVKLVRENGREQLIETPDLEINCHQQIATSRLDNKYFRIRDYSIYEVHGEIECGKTNTWIFKSESSEGQVMAINDISMKALRKFKERGLLSFWKKRITMKWPSDGDYYDWNTVNITRGDHWDVVGHELGHAIYDQADIGYFGGGRHRIDECYTGSLALSEGWASFFSAWLSIGLKDNDAKFEYLVKRRAPIRIEHIPADVCHGPTNEWRVTGFLWDIIDLSYDEESSEVAFSELWKLTLNKKFSDVTKLAKSLRKSIDPILVNLVYENNFLVPLD